MVSATAELGEVDADLFIFSGDSSDFGPRSTTKEDETSLSLSEVYSSRDPAVRSSLWTMVLSQLFQQISGINAVMYYSVG